ncbi:MAG: hypothetical protein Q7U74_10755, partial [Saprospiraceae bacterium]|nr:hypothetical protein [Saprospiraceae bacterium]
MIADKTYLIENVLKHTDKAMLGSMVQQQLKVMRSDENDKPIVFVGAGTCGLGAGAAETMNNAKAWLLENGIDAEVIPVGCIGLCSSEPLLDVKLPGRKRISFEHVSGDKVKGILNEIFAGNLPAHAKLGQFGEQESQQSWEGVPNLKDHPFFKPQLRIVLENCGVSNPVSIEEYIARDGYKAYLNSLKVFSREDLCDFVEKSGLRGRGGGGFPTGKKWKFALGTEADQKYLICNADEGDPGAFMDRAVIEGDPHKLLEGMAIAAYAIGASKAYVYIRAEYPLAIERLVIAIDQAREYGLIGKNIFGYGIDLDIVIKKGAGAFVCGEETALIHSIEGKRGMPRPRPPFPATSGLFGKPTIINNVETLSNLPTIVNKGADWFSSMGTATSKGTKVFALSGKISLTGLVEIPMGTTV